ncbi:TolC family protein [Taibaiella lutea]|uniref:TolC family protein n=1 Tax=Taibaiella lutea TaxID=2608001 RepID=A0A5M6CN70_9BACT|nr:TolC family protein [Taibaiella lutea]KAA5536493.1 TolC family protein [Taibaiella lutea]
MRKKIIFSVIASLMCLMVRAQDTTVNGPILTLKDAIDIALDQNFNIRIAKVSLEQAKANNTIGNAGMLPTISAIGTLSKSITDAKIELATGAEQNRHNAQATTLGGAAQLNWTLFDGLRMFIAKDRLNEMEQIGNIQLRSQVQATVSQVIISYSSVVYEKQQLIALDTAMSLAYSRMTIAKKNFEVGTSAKTDYLQAQVDYNASKYASILQDAKLRQLKDSLMLLLSRDQFADFDVEDSLKLNPDLTFNAKELWMSDNFDVQLAAEQKQLSVFDLALTKRLQIPTLNLAASYNYNRLQNDAGATLFNRTYGPQVGLNLNLPIFDGFNLQRQKKVARLEVNRQDLLYQYTQSRVAMQYRVAWRAYKNALEGLNLEKENIKYAAENVMIQQARFKVGVSNTLELREAENSYVAALTRLVDAGYTLKVAEIKLLVIENKLVR